MASPERAAPHVTDQADRRRWLALAALTAAIVVVTLDTTILNVAVPTIRHELHTDLASLQWVLAGYSLTLGSLLIVGGRLGDLFGTRRAFVAGALIFTAGSLLASMATSVGLLVLGEAVIEGVGASLLLPAAFASVSTVFSGRDRAKAFGVIGGAGGAAAALGPVIGGWLTTDFSWRWGFRINVVLAPVAALVALAVLPRMVRPKARPRLDIAGATSIAVTLFVFVFGITEGASYGWFTPTRAFTIAGATIWPASAPVSAAAAAFILAAVTAVGFLALERSRERSGGAPLVALTDFRVPTFRFGLATAAAVVMAQSGVMFALAVFLQATHQLTAARTGAWLLPIGVAVVVGANAGGAIAGRLGPPVVVRAGVALELVGVVIAACTISSSVGFVVLAPALLLFGLGAGLANSQLWNVILSEVPRERAGSASGVATTNSAVAAALGVAVLGTVLRAADTNGAGPVRWALLAAIGVLAVGAASAAALSRPHPDPGRAPAGDQPDRLAPPVIFDRTEHAEART